MSLSASDFSTLLKGYRLCALSEGHSPRSVEAVEEGVTYFVRFMAGQGLAIPATQVSSLHIRAFIAYLQHKPRFAGHRINPPRNELLSSHTVNCYARSLRVFFSWLESEELIEHHPFESKKSTGGFRINP